MSQKEEKKNRVLEVIEYYAENGEFPKGEQVKELAEKHGVDQTTIRDDIRKAKESYLGDKFTAAMNKIVDGFLDGEVEMKPGDVIKGYQVTRPKQVEQKLDIKAQIDIRGDAIGDALRVLNGIKQREDIHKERDGEG